jgi:hypothetical protein
LAQLGREQRLLREADPFIRREPTMTKMLTTLLAAAVAALLTIVAPAPGFAADAKDEAINLDQHTNPDVTPRDRYQQALDKAADALKRNLAHCDRLQAGERAECVREARALYDGDAAKAADVLARPQ